MRRRSHDLGADSGIYLDLNADGPVVASVGKEQIEAGQTVRARPLSPCCASIKVSECQLENCISYRWADWANSG
jgi:hypothetical protein